MTSTALLGLFRTYDLPFKVTLWSLDLNWCCRAVCIWACPCVITSSNSLHTYTCTARVSGDNVRLAVCIYTVVPNYESSCICCCVSCCTDSYSLHHLRSTSCILTTASAIIIFSSLSYCEQSHHIFIFVADNLISYSFFFFPNQLNHYFHMIVVCSDSHLPHQDYTQD